MGTGYKPKVIKALEDAIFASIFAIAVGSSPEHELGVLAKRWRSLSTDPGLNDARLWFANLGGVYSLCLGWANIL